MIKENLTRSKQILTSKSKNGNNLFESKIKQMILPVWKKKKKKRKSEWSKQAGWSIANVKYLLKNAARTKSQIVPALW